MIPSRWHAGRPILPNAASAALHDAAFVRQMDAAEGSAECRRPLWRQARIQPRHLAARHAAPCQLSQGARMKRLQADCGPVTPFPGEAAYASAEVQEPGPGLFRFLQHTAPATWRPH